MIITCPACSSQYVLPDDSIGAKGRRVKCTTCAYTWLQAPEIEAIPASLMPGKPIFEIPEYREGSAPKPRMTPISREKSTVKEILKASASLLAVLLVATFGLACVMRMSLIQHYPASILFFEKAGLATTAPAKGLSFKTVKADIIKTPNKPDLLSVSGKLSNETKKDVPLTKLVIRLSGEKGWLKDWPVDLYGKSLPAGKSTDFSYDLKDFPQDGQNVTLLFTD